MIRKNLGIQLPSLLGPVFVGENVFGITPPRGGDQ